MLQARRNFHKELTLLEEDVLHLGEEAAKALEKGMRALAHRDHKLVNEVIEGDDVLDEMYMDIEHRILSLLATQTPVASDLRLISAILHANLHLERVGDMAVNIAKVTSATMDLPRSDLVLSHLEEMGDLVSKMLRAALDAFSLRDVGLAEKLPDMDEPVDRLNRNMYREVVALAHDQGLLDWGIRMNMVSRQLERVGDHAVDIGEQVAFLLTGEFREFTDASHPTSGE